MKPVVILNLITNALSGRQRRHLPTEDSHPITPAETRREIGLAVAVVTIALASVFAIVLSIFWAGEP
jgi:hypothetical protein